MPCYDHKVTVQLFPNPIPHLPSYHEPYSLICREGRQVLHRPTNTVNVSVDASGCRRVAVGVKPEAFFRNNPHVGKFRVTVDVDTRRAVTHYYTTDQLQWCEGEILTDCVSLFKSEGIIEILFEPLTKEPCSPPVIKFQMMYSKKPQYEDSSVLLKTSMFRHNPYPPSKALWLLQNDPFSCKKVLTRMKEGKPDSSYQSNLRGLQHSRFNGQESGSSDSRSSNKSQDSHRDNKRKREYESRRDGDDDDVCNNKENISLSSKRSTEDNDHRRKLMRENQTLEDEIKRLKLIKEQNKLKEELKLLQNEVENHDEGVKRHGEKMDAALLMTPPLTTDSNAPGPMRMREFARLE